MDVTKLRYAMVLTPDDQAALNGERGPAVKMAMTILVRMLAAFGTDRFLDICAAHIDSSLFQGDATLIYAETLAQKGAQVVVPTTLNVSGVDEHGWQDWSVPPEWAKKAFRQMVAYESMGCKPTWTCAPYQESTRPKLGEQIAWGESSAVVFANSVLGARTERYPDLMDICAAITGRAPAAGLHITENRAGQVLFQLQDIPEELQQDDSFYGVLGHLIGAQVGRLIPVIDGLSVEPTEDQLKALGAAMASSGSVALYHLVGVTPEASSLDEAFLGRQPVKIVPLTLSELRRAKIELSTHDGDSLDLVVLGSPHFSLNEFKDLSNLVAGKRRHSNVRFLITASRFVRTLADRQGYLAKIRAFGGTVTVDTCLLTTPMLPKDVRVLMTNSAKYAYYSPGLLNTSIVFGSLRDCVNSAVAGTVERDDSIWDS